MFRYAPQAVKGKPQECKLDVGFTSGGRSPGNYAKSNVQLVEKIVRIARELGREVASPEEARQIAGI